MNKNSLELFSLLSENSHVTDEQMQNAYKSFVEQITTISQSQQSYPEQFPQVEQLAFKSMLSLIPKSPNLGIMGMAEILTSLKLLEGIEDEAGENPSTIAYSNTFEHAFDFRFNDIYDCQRELFKRKPYNLTRTLDAMKTALTKEYNRRKSEKGKNKDGKR